ncbi:MAG: peptidase dimerization domain-containing protein [Oscillospiraceae bacterium]
MPRVLEHLEPKAVFHFFEDLTRIPHGSRNTKAISDYCAAFARARGLWVYQDELNNVIITKPASAGYETAPAVILQGHLDMVAEKTPESPIDMTKDALALQRRGRLRVRRDGTTLGGDDGIAVAMALAILDSSEIAHPALEAVFTVDEEIGMEGAQGLDFSQLSARRMLNIDSEDEGIFTVSCAGGSSANVSVGLTMAPNAAPCAKLSVSGLIGGHSGQEINKGRANANILLGRVLDALVQKLLVRLVSAAGGRKDNAIPNAAEAVLALAEGDLPAAKQIVSACTAGSPQGICRGRPRRHRHAGKSSRLPAGTDGGGDAARRPLSAARAERHCGHEHGYPGTGADVVQSRHFSRGGRRADGGQLGPQLGRFAEADAAGALCGAQPAARRLAAGHRRVSPRGNTGASPCCGRRWPPSTSSRSAGPRRSRPSTQGSNAACLPGSCRGWTASPSARIWSISIPRARRCPSPRCSARGSSCSAYWKR